MMRKEGMKMKKTLAILIIIVLAVVGTLPTSAQWNNNAQQQRFGAVAPSVTFQSTSIMTGSGSAYSANPTIGANGAAYMPGASSAPGRRPGIRKADNDHDGFDDETGLPVDNIDNPIIDPNDPGNVPLGEALLPLLLMALVYFAIRRKRSVRPSALLRLSLGHGPVMLPFMIA